MDAVLINRFRIKANRQVLPKDGTRGELKNFHRIVRALDGLIRRGAAHDRGNHVRLSRSASPLQLAKMEEFYVGARLSTNSVHSLL